MGDYTKQTPETEARYTASVADKAQETAAARFLLETELATWCYEHLDGIRANVARYRERFGREPNALGVPVRFESVAWGATFLGLALVTPIFHEDVTYWRTPRAVRCFLPATPRPVELAEPEDVADGLAPQDAE